VFGGRVLHSEVTGHFEDSTTVDDPCELRRRLVESGYLFLRDVLDVSSVLAAREEVFSRLVEVGEIKLPASDGIATGQSRRLALVDDLIAFWQSVSEGPLLRQVSHGSRVSSLMQSVFGEPARPQDYLWLRPRAVGWSTRFHYDHPFFARGSRSVYTVWIPLGDIPYSDGPLMLVEDSHKFDDLIEPMHDRNEQFNSSPTVAEQAAFRGQWAQDTVAFAIEREVRLLSAEFRTGDVLIFGMNTLHGAMDNHSMIDRVRLSCDVRYQPASDPIDERYFGPCPTGASGKGYGDMNSCKPLTQTG
jgi:ectoine hydroxylase-related dioxygenase (phytanoyl-CoA dioxygenase family)